MSKYAGITPRAEGGYHCYVDLGRKPDGKRDVRHITRKTREAVRLDREKLLDRVRDGLRADADKMTLGAYMDLWLRSKQAQERREYSDNTLDDYEDAVARLTPLLGQVRMSTPPRELTKLIEIAAGELRRRGRRNPRLPSRLAAHPARLWALGQGLPVKSTGQVPQHIQAAWRAAGSPAPTTAADIVGKPYDSLTAEQKKALMLSRVYVRNIINKLSIICNEAVRDGLMRINPVHGAQLPEPKAERPKVAFTAEQVQATTATLTGRDLVRWSLAVGLGLRQGEVLGFRWSRLDLDAAIATVDTQAQRRRWQHGCTQPDRCGKAARCPKRHGGGMYLKEQTKEEDEGKIPLSAPMVAVLRAHRTAQRRERFAAGQLWTDLDLVFCTATGGIVDRSNDNKHWHRILADNGLPAAGTHSAKNTAITLAFDQGIDELVVSKFVGRHASGPAFTRKAYQQEVPGRAREMAEVMGQVVFG